jgi:hypothetical protein
VYQCPKIIASDPLAQSVYQQFILWRSSDRSVWPDGGAPLDQPAALINAFSMMDGLIMKQELKQIEAQREKARNGR